ncbi:MAG: tetratricopeptide repeat protein [Elusimicrobiota bacterium]
MKRTAFSGRGAAGGEGAVALLGKAEALLTKNSPALALPLLKAAAGRARRDVFLKAEIAAQTAEALRALGRFKESLSSYWNAHRLYRLGGVPSERLRALLGASACLRILGHFDRARAMWRSVSGKEFFRVADPSPDVVLLEIALVERGAGNLKRARALLARCLRGLKRRGDAEALRHAWWALGGTERFLGNYPAALAAYRRAEISARRLKDDSAAGYALCGQAGCLRVLGRWRESLRRYRRAHEIFAKAGDPFGRAYGLCGMGNAWRVGGDAEKSLPLYKASAALYRRVGDEGSRAFAFWGLGGSLRRLGKHSAAAAHYRRALKIFRKVKDARGEVSALLGLGRVLKESGRPGSQKFFRRAAAAARAAGLPYERALCRFQAGQSSPAAFRPFGISPSAAAAWKYIP